MACKTRHILYSLPILNLGYYEIDVFFNFRENPVYLSALYLINQTNLIMMTVKDRCE